MYIPLRASMHVQLGSLGALSCPCTALTSIGVRSFRCGGNQLAHAGLFAGNFHFPDARREVHTTRGCSACVDLCGPHETFSVASRPPLQMRGVWIRMRLYYPILGIFWETGTRMCTYHDVFFGTADIAAQVAKGAQYSAALHIVCPASRVSHHRCLWLANGYSVGRPGPLNRG